MPSDSRSCNPNSSLHMLTEVQVLNFYGLMPRYNYRMAPVRIRQKSWLGKEQSNSQFAYSLTCQTRPPTPPSRNFHTRERYHHLSLCCHGQLSMPTAALCGVVRVDHARLTLVGLRKSISTLLPHSLYLAHLPDGLLELFHPGESLVSNMDHTKHTQREKSAYLGL